VRVFDIRPEVFLILYCSVKSKALNLKDVFRPSQMKVLFPDDLFPSQGSVFSFLDSFYIMGYYINWIRTCWTLCMFKKIEFSFM